MSAFIKTIGYLLGGGSSTDDGDATTQSSCVDDVLWFEILKRFKYGKLASSTLVVGILTLPGFLEVNQLDFMFLANAQNAHKYPCMLRYDHTCQLFRKILVSSRFWIEKCEYDGICIPPLSWRKYLRRKELEGSSDPDSLKVLHVLNYKKVFFRQPYQRDLALALRSSSTLKSLEEQGMVFEHGGDGQDCGATYELHLQLLRREEHFNANVHLPRFRTVVRSWDQWEGGRLWETVEEVFMDYPIGMRKLAIMSRGKDNQFWAGHYGSKFGATEVLLSFPENPRLLSAEDFPDGEKIVTNAIPTRHPLHSLRVPVALRGRFPARRHV
ncbi:unnamed protein product [Angiostrongylus costaricensis]|uniref:FBA domain-containing protein n=1 Tax=Angiostrongylus costaricensis TaxID=334426 RepID=A0A0R3PQ27_ANGCS|nr:unnamed protein product [Angiostrongylus costaricensis]